MRKSNSCELHVVCSASARMHRAVKTDRTNFRLSLTPAVHSGDAVGLNKLFIFIFNRVLLRINLIKDIILFIDELLKLQNKIYFQTF